MSLYGEAERLMRMCVDDEGNPPANPAPELDSYLRLAQVCATLAVAGELRRSNEDRANFNATMREFFERLTEPQPEPDGSPVGSGQPAAAPGCPVCGNPDIGGAEECLFADLTFVEWRTHRQHYFELALSYLSEASAAEYADNRMRLDFGTCSEGP